MYLTFKYQRIFVAETPVTAHCREPLVVSAENATEPVVRPDDESKSCVIVGVPTNAVAAALAPRVIKPFPLNVVAFAALDLVATNVYSKLTAE